jgi:acyl-CoA thioesterase-2
VGVAERLALEQTDVDVFVNVEPTDPHHVFGGMLVGQALRAAALTVEGRHPCSLHASFVVAGTGGEQIRYEVERTRDGSSFTTRRVVAHQARGAVLVLTADFHEDEAGLEYTAALGDVGSPEGHAPGRYDNPMFESRDVPPTGEPPHARRAWFRAVDPMPDDDALHLQALAMLTDFGPTRAAREPHARLADEGQRQSVSLDHSVWFHRPARVDEWVLSELVPVSTGRGRGLAMGTVRDAEGTLLASFAQEVLLRVRR